MSFEAMGAMGGAILLPARCCEQEVVEDEDEARAPVALHSSAAVPGVLEPKVCISSIKTGDRDPICLPPPKSAQKS